MQHIQLRKIQRKTQRKTFSPCLHARHSRNQPPQIPNPGCTTSRTVQRRIHRILPLNQRIQVAKTCLHPFYYDPRGTGHDVFVLGGQCEEGYHCH